TMPRMARRVVWGLVEVIATFSPTSALVSVDLPTFGRPPRATKPERGGPAPCAPAPPGSWPSSPGWPSCRCPAPIAVLLPLVLLVLVLRGPAHQHGGQALAAAGALLRLEFETEHVHLGAGDRHPSGGLGQQSADAVDVVVVQLETEQVADLGEPRPRGDPVP